MQIQAKKTFFVFMLFTFMSQLSFAGTKQDGKEVLKHLFKSERVLTNNSPVSPDSIDMAPTAAASIRALAKAGYFLGQGRDLKYLTLEELESANFGNENILVIIEENEFGEFKASIQMYLPVDSGSGFIEAANVYIFIEGSKSGDTIKIKKVTVDFRGIS